MAATITPLIIKSTEYEMEKSTIEFYNKKFGVIMLICAATLLLLAFFCDTQFVEKWFVHDGQLDPENFFYLALIRTITLISSLSFFVIWVTRKKIIYDFFKMKDYWKRNKTNISMSEMVPKFDNKPLNNVLYILFSIWVLFILYSLLVNPKIASSFSHENGIFETITVIMYLFAVFLLLKTVFLIKEKKYFFILYLLCFAGFCFFVAGEEISWGQQYFEIKTPSLIKEVNFQGELGLHNIPIPGFQIYFINNLSRYLAFFCGIVLPLLLLLSANLRRLMKLLNIIIPPYLSILFFILAASIPYDRYINSHTIFGDLSLIGNLPSELREITISIAFFIWAYSIYRTERSEFI